jgi:toluene monooxygenase system protein E
MTPRELRALRAIAPARRTYLCLEGNRRKPTDYEVTSTALLYYPARGFEVSTPAWEHYVRYQRDGKLRGTRWDSFEDPAQLTYSAYVAERRDQEAFLDRLLERPVDAPRKDLRPLLGLLSALRFPLHGLQMVAAYVGALAPSGRISIALAFQAADEMRRVQRICQWLSRSGIPAAQLDALGREIWQQKPAFQPLRRLVEELLVTYDWGDALLGLNGVLKPIFDRLWFEQVAGVAERHDDEILEKILSSLGDDGRWHESWFINFSRLALDSHEANAELMRERVDSLRPAVTRAVQALLPAFEGLLGDDGERAYIWRELEGGLSAHLSKAGLRLESSGEASLVQPT